MSARTSVFPVMGTVASLTFAEHVDQEARRIAEQAARVSLAADEQRFSHYRLDSDITRWLGGESLDWDAHEEIEAVLTECLLLQTESNGAFTITDPATGRIDTAGYVKGYAINKAVEAVRARGVRDFTVNVGGDSYSSGAPAPDRPWRVAIADPTRSHAIAAIIDATDLAVATSGTAERGEHIWFRSGPVVTDLVSFTVTGPDITWADAYATVGFAMGAHGIEWVARHPGYASLAIGIDGRVRGDAALVSVV